MLYRPSRQAMMYRPSEQAIIAALWIVAVIHMDGCSGKSLADKPLCQSQNSTIIWDSNPQTTQFDVYWQYGNKFTCFTDVMCLGPRDDTIQHTIDTSTTNIDDNSNNDSNNYSNLIMQPGEVPVQLKPAQLQKGNIIRFHLKRYVNTTYPNIYKVNRTAFSACDVTCGQLVRTDDGKEIFELPQKFLDFGDNFFIVESNLRAFVSCDLGLRLHVIVKHENCTGNDVDVCGGRGVCGTTRSKNNFECVCCGTYKGVNCSIFDPCLNHPCQNDGECTHDNQQLNKTYECKCPVGYYGKDCQLKAKNICDIVKCLNNGTCTGNDTDFHCTCAPGWTGSRCEVNINECARMPCRHGDCTDKINGYQCSCFPGYYGHDCELRHQQCSFGPCRNRGFCHNKTVVDDFDYQCHCQVGWAGRDCSQKVPKCDPNPCDVHGMCMDYDDDYRCVCEPGYMGRRCEVNMNDCDPNPCMHGGHCIDLDKGHICQCRKNYVGDNCQYTVTPYSPPVINNIVIINKSQEEPKTSFISIIAAIITSVVIIILCILIGCYFRINGCRKFNGITAFRHREPNRDLTVSVSTPGSQQWPLATNPYFTEMGSQSKLDIGVVNTGYQSEVV